MSSPSEPRDVIDPQTIPVAIQELPPNARRPMRRRWKVVLWIAASGLITLAVVTIVGLLLLRQESITSRLTRELARRLDSDVTIAELDVAFAPRPRVVGKGLVIRQRGRPSLPPVITVDEFEVTPGIWSAITGHVNVVYVDGMHINLPADARGELATMSVSESQAAGTKTGKKTIADHLICHNVELRFSPSMPGKEPLYFPIQDLAIDGVGFEKPMTFIAKLTNPIPVGLIDAKGVFGPWNVETPGDTPVSGAYVFRDADLSTINGIGGTLNSTGTFAGRLDEIVAVGESDTPNFSLDLGGKPVALHAKFEVLVNGTDGSTVLRRVDAMLGHTPIVATGTIMNLPGPGRHDFNLDFSVVGGRIEDLLRLASDSPEPLLTGNVSVRAKLALPPGEGRVSNRIRISGQFGLEGANFGESSFQGQLESLSRRSQGKRTDDPMGAVATNLHGKFSLEKGVLSLPDLNFEVPGAVVAIAGTYGVENGALDFHGTLSMKAKVSQTVSGIKSLFLKLVDPIFKKNGAGAVIPIHILGTRDDPKVGMDVGRIFK